MLYNLTTSQADRIKFDEAQERYAEAIMQVHMTTAMFIGPMTLTTSGTVLTNIVIRFHLLMN